jgi:hypothetical protein
MAAHACGKTAFLVPICALVAVDHAPPLRVCQQLFNHLLRPRVNINRRFDMVNQ